VRLQNKDDKRQKVVDYMLYFRHFFDLFHKLSKKKPRINEQMPNYALYILLYPIV
jgi:hypothetical protein